MSLVRILPFAIAATLAMPAVAQATAKSPAAASASSDMEILRRKINADKKLLVASNMALTEAQAKAFWPVYDAYQAQLKTINERVARAVSDYAAEYRKGAVSGEAAKKLLDEAIAIEEAEAKLRRTLGPQVERAVGPAMAVRYDQIEGRIRAVIRYELASAIPVAE
jgi:hypothetical protein